MARVGVSITKSCSFRGAAQEFSNTYYYQTPLPVTEGTADALIDAIVAKEKALFANSVTFVRARCWTAGGTKAENNMLAQKPLSGVGTPVAAGSGTGFDKERAFLVRLRAGNDSKGRPVYLRKWWHLDVSAIGGTSISSTQLQNTSPLAAGQRAALVTAANDLKSVGAGIQTFELVSEKGRQIDGDTVAHQYLEHHQLGDMWRG